MNRIVCLFGNVVDYMQIIIHLRYLLFYTSVIRNLCGDCSQQRVTLTSVI